MISALRLVFLLAATLAAPVVLAQSAPAPKKQNSNVPSGGEKQFPLGASWVAVSLNGRALQGDRPTLNLDQNLRAKGYGGCNTFSVTAYPLRRQGFAVGPIAMTKKACSKEAMELERSYLTALRTAQAWDLVGGQLVLKGQAGEIRFDRGL